MHKLTSSSSVLGSFLGGALANPVEKYPSVFLRGSIFEQYPFLLPNLVSTVVSTCSFLIGLLFLEETHAERKSEQDRGLQVGQWLLRQLHVVGAADVKRSSCSDDGFNEHSNLLPKGSRPSSQSSQSTSSSSYRDGPKPSIEQSVEESNTIPIKRGFFDGFTRQVNLHIVAYGLLAL